MSSIILIFVLLWISAETKVRSTGRAMSSVQTCWLGLLVLEMSMILDV